jgi:hypothetical protein
VQHCLSFKTLGHSKKAFWAKNDGNLTLTKPGTFLQVDQLLQLLTSQNSLTGFSATFATNISQNKRHHLVIIFFLGLYCGFVSRKNKKAIFLQNERKNAKIIEAKQRNEINSSLIHHFFFNGDCLETSESKRKQKPHFATICPPAATGTQKKK